MTAEPCSGFLLHGQERLVGLGERKDGNLGANVQVARGLKEVAGVLPGHVGDTANLALAPE